MCARAIQAHRKANPSFKLNTNLPAIEEELDVVTSARVAGIPGAESYLMDVGSAQPSFQVASSVPTLAKLVSAVGAVKTAKDVLFDWEESGKPPVTQEVAAKRAGVCVACPLNEKGGLDRFFTVPAAALIKARLEKLHNMKMTTPSDVALGICGACLCVNKLKVWTPIEFIKEHTPPEIVAKFDSKCWVLSEGKNL